MVLPSPVKLSTRKSDISNDSIVFEITVPQNTSSEEGADLNCIFSRSTTLKPSVYDESLFGFWITLLIAIFNCVELLIFTSEPPLWVALKFWLTPSNAAFKVCAVPLPTDDKFIFVLLFAFAKVVANLIVLWVSRVTKYAVPAVSYTHLTLPTKRIV